MDAGRPPRNKNTWELEFAWHFFQGDSLRNDDLIKPDKDHAQILIEVSTEIESAEKARQIIESLGIHIIQSEKISSSLMLLKLDVKDMREVVLKLTENGFLEIEGYNASSL